MAPAFEGRREPDVHDVQSFGLGDGALAEGKDVGVVVRAVPNGDLFVPAETAADAFDAVGDDGFAVAGAAKDDAALIVAAGDGLGHGPDKIGVVAARLGMGAEVAHGVAGVEEHGLDGFLVGKAGVIGADGDGEGVGHGGAGARGLGWKGASRKVSRPGARPHVRRKFAAMVCHLIDDKLAVGTGL